MKKIIYVITALSIATFTACSSNKQDSESEKWNSRISTAFKELCNRDIKPTFINSSGNEQGKWVNFSYEKISGKKIRSSLKFNKVDGKWKLSKEAFEQRDVICN